MILIDTGYLIALLNVRDELHGRAVEWSKSVVDSLIVTEYVLWECVNYWSVPVDRPKAAAVVHHLRSEPQYQVIVASTELFDAGLDLHTQRTDKSWSLTDCISFVVMHRLGVTQALAFDHHFEEAGFEALLRRTPA